MAGTGQTSIRSYNFFASTTLAGGGTYAENQHDFVDLDDQTPFLSKALLIVNDGVTTLSVRFTADPGGGAAHSTVLAGEKISLDFKRVRRVYLSGAAALAVRIWAW